MAFVDLIGQSESIQRLEKSIYENRLSHAYLFFGPAGVGKRTAALALAKRLLCERPQEIKSCGPCSACLKVEKGVHPDLRLVAVEENSIKIDLIREIQNWLAIIPFEANRKVVIFDHAEKISRGAANALLKTLEEPPSHALMILVAPAVQSILPTVASRCQKIPFRSLTPEELMEGLKRLSLYDAQIDSIVPWAQGSLGKAIQLKNQMEEVTALTDGFFSFQKFRSERVALIEKIFKERENWEWCYDVIALMIRKQIIKEEKGFEWMDALGEFYRALELNVAPRIAIERFFYRVEQGGVRV
ncbi:MAG: DNA polymerase III subunit delta' [Deltaproteobacteria bacterium]|nr:DNA polymerase III subunit delta' [Deltaproteobacteria bacterium]